MMERSRILRAGMRRGALRVAIGGVLVAGGAIAVTGVPQGPAGASAPLSQTFGYQTFGYTGTQQSFVVPAGVSSVTVVATGASGGVGFHFSTKGAGGTGGRGAEVSAQLSVTPGETLYIEVGGPGAPAPGSTGAGSGGFNGGAAGGNNGGGGGGASDVRTCSAGATTCPTGATSSLASRLVVAGGGAGGGGGFTTLPRGSHHPSHWHVGVGGRLP